jgi:hypothetical protein
VRERFFTPRLRVASGACPRAARSADPGEELNAWLLDRCVAYAKAHKHPELADRTIWQAFEAERPQLVQITGSFDGFHATQASVSKTYARRRRWKPSRTANPKPSTDTALGSGTGASVKAVKAVRSAQQGRPSPQL